MSLEIRNDSSQPRWTPQEAAFTGIRGPSLQARLVVEGQGAIGPGEQGRVLAVVDMPTLSADTFFTLELRGESGRTLKLPNIRFLKAMMEGGQ
ncbi:uncharacterized protein STAUR_2429 [Stigmatella aurantiaca DW4/3-1]|uniref:Uncharacterized protein n=1 Tax=Stigmatella aurantiaca (strain DW4/3-1) TaxID=378806 RepID=E3FG98_STIAD|nr:uncharacterized protein STAUR_2429 [Stigmatella aurantiaca DW4/3-1]